MNDTIKRIVSDTIEGLSSELRGISLQIHDNPELGNQEFASSKLLIDTITRHGFTVTREPAGLKTAFIATYTNGHGRRVGFCSEYDALPDIGHGCGHNLIAISGLACAIATKTLLEKEIIQGTVVLFGTPAEETTSGKISLVLAEEFQRRVDVALMLHPFAENGLYARMLALDTATVEFFGRAAHAGMGPWEGINAVDAFMQGYDNMSMLRQQTLPSNRMHGIITNGGKAPNIIPDYASGKFYVRSITRQQLGELKPRFENCFKAAANATGCDIKFTWGPLGPVEDVAMNTPMAECYKRYMEDCGIHFASRLEEEQIVSGSTDMGNVSYVVPSIHPAYGIHTTATNHTADFTAAARTEKAHELTLQASTSLVCTAAHVYLDDLFYKEILDDFQKLKG